MSDFMKLQAEIEALRGENAKLRGETTSNGYDNAQLRVGVGLLASEYPNDRRGHNTIDPPESPHVEIKGMQEKGRKAEEIALKENEESAKRVLPATAKGGDPKGTSVSPDAVDDSDNGRPGLAAATKSRESEKAADENAKAQAKAKKD